jgi:hypothetical protein
MSRKLWAVLGDAATKDFPPADRENKNGHPPLDVASDILPLPVHDPTCGVSVGIRFYFASIAFDYLHAYYSGDAPFLFFFFFSFCSFLSFTSPSQSCSRSSVGWLG